MGLWLSPWVRYRSLWQSLWRIGGELAAVTFRSFTTEADETLIIATFSRPVSSADFTAGVTIDADTVAQVVSSGTLQTNERIVHFVVGSALSLEESLTFSYDSATGSIVDSDGNEMDDLAAEIITNMLGAYLDFQWPSDSAHIATIGL